MLDEPFLIDSSRIGIKLVTILRPRFPLPFELKRTISFASDTPRGDSLPILVSDESLFDPSNYASGHRIYLNPLNKWLYSADLNNNTQILAEQPIESANDLVLQLFPDRIETSLNGIKAAAIKRSFREGAVIGIASDTTHSQPKCTFSNVVVRRLDPDDGLRMQCSI